MVAKSKAWSWAGAGAFVAAVIACGGSSSNVGPGPGSALCGSNGTIHCGTGEVCDPALGCVQCTSSANCPASAHFCINGQCSVCQSNADCTAPMSSCWPSDHTCHAPCAANTACPNDMSICTSTGACVQCNTNMDCAADPVRKICDPTTQQCVQCDAMTNTPQGTNSACPAGEPFCFLGDERCVQCLSNANCGTAQPICDPQEFQCRAGCMSNAQCSPPTQICNTMTSTCVQCLSNMDCAQSSTPYCSMNGRCVQCTSDSNCMAPTPYCAVDAGMCVQCTHAKQCSPGQICANGTCR